MKKRLANIDVWDILFYSFATFVLIVWIPYQKNKLDSVDKVAMTDSLGRKVTIIDHNLDGIPDYTEGLAPQFNRAVTEKEKQYFLNHKQKAR